MKNLVLLVLLLAAAPLSAQAPPSPPKGGEKGATPISPPLGGTEGTTRAVVIGISDYQDADIPDLRFADRDAEAFADWLRSPAGGSLDDKHLKLLTNQGATMAKFAAALDWLLDVCREGDQAIIYFSGHGDVERKTVSQPGFLLCWDAPSHVYMGGGTYSLSYLQEIVTTLSIQNKARVTVVMDACHAGKLAGSQIGGSQLTAASMAKQFANEVKILSCQPDEYSLEGEQWGGGRGVFSYHLVDGLLGLADRNSDAGITLGELNRYLEEHVTPEAAPQRQIPVVLGNKAERLAAVVPDVVAKLKKNQLAQNAVFSKTESRSLENEVLAGADSVLFHLYRSFEKALEMGAFFEPEGACADFYYQKLAVEPALSRLHNTMRRNYAAALQDDAQQVMNRFLKTDMDEITLSQKRQAIRYDKYPRCLERAAQLLGPQHYMYPVLQARRHFFDGYLSALVCKQTDSLLATKALEDFREALRWQPELPQAYWQMGLLYGYNMLQPDSADYYARQAIQMAPGWLLPYTNTAFLFSKSKQYDRAKWYLEQAREIDSTSVLVWNGLGTLYFNQHDFAAAEQAYRMAAQLDTQVAVFPYNLGLVYLHTGRPTEAEQAWYQAIQLDSTYDLPHVELGSLFIRQERYDEAEQHYLTAIRLNPAAATWQSYLGSLYGTMQRYSEAEQAWYRAIQLDSTYDQPHALLGRLFIWQEQYTEAEHHYLTAARLNPTEVTYQFYLGSLYMAMQRFPEAENHFLRAVQLDPTFHYAHNELGKLYLKTGRASQAEAMFMAFAHDVQWKNTAMLNMACVRVAQKRSGEAFEFLEEALKTGSDLESLESDTDLAPLRAQPEWKPLMKKYFPDKVKD